MFERMSSSVITGGLFLINFRYSASTILRLETGTSSSGIKTKNNLITLLIL